jgi:hypothetical protein
MMTTHGTGGYLLSGIKVIKEEGGGRSGGPRPGRDRGRGSGGMRAPKRQRR